MRPYILSALRVNGINDLTHIYRFKPSDWGMGVLTPSCTREIHAYLSEVCTPTQTNRTLDAHLTDFPKLSFSREMCLGFELEHENFPRWDTYQQSKHDPSDEDVK
jgi:hypothetical protein